MPKNTNKTKNRGKFWFGIKFLNWKKLNYFNEVKNLYFSTFSQNCTQTTKVKTNQTLFDRTNSNLRSLFLIKKIVFQWLLKLNSLGFMSRVNPNNRNETKPDIFSWDIFKSQIIFHCSQKTKIYFHNFNNWHLSISLQKWVETKIKIKRGMCKSDRIFPYLQSFLI